VFVERIRYACGQDARGYGSNQMHTIAALLSALEQHGMLLKQDTRLPSVVGIILGEPPRGSWWGHPRGHEIFAVLSELADHPDVLFTKLLSRKDTLVHRRVWPDLLTVGSARAEWQMDGLSASAISLLAELDLGTGPIIASGSASKELLNRLLVVGREVHTESGRHAMGLESWAAWSRRAGCQTTGSKEAARANLEAIAEGLGAAAKALPWR
jgi:hypothetical protein